MTKEEALAALEEIKAELQMSDSDRLARIEKKLDEIDRKVQAIPTPVYPIMNPVPYYRPRPYWWDLYSTGDWTITTNTSSTSDNNGAVWYQPLNGTIS